MKRSNFSPQAFAINQSYFNNSRFMTNAKTAADTGGHAINANEGITRTH